MSGQDLSLAISVFLACAVEAVEAFIVVLAVGTTRRWSSALAGVGAVLVAPAVVIGALGSTLTSLPPGVLRLLGGGLLLVFGLQWLVKAILRAAGATSLPFLVAGILLAALAMVRYGRRQMRAVHRPAATA